MLIQKKGVESLSLLQSYPKKLSPFIGVHSDSECLFIMMVTARIFIFTTVTYKWRKLHSVVYFTYNSGKILQKI